MQLIIIYIFSSSLVQVSVHMKPPGSYNRKRLEIHKKKTMYEVIIPFT